MSHPIITPEMIDKALAARLEGMEFLNSLDAANRRIAVAGIKQEVIKTLEAAFSEFQPQVDLEELDNSLKKAEHPGHRIHVLMHPEDTWVLTTLTKAAKAYTALFTKGEQDA